MAKQVTTIRLDQDLIDRLDAVAKERGESRSEMIERILNREVGVMEEFLRDMESPMGRAMTRALMSNPLLIKAVFSIAGEKLEDGDVERIMTMVPDQAERGRERAGKKRGKRVRKSGEPDEGLTDVAFG